MGSPATFNPTPESLLVEHPICVDCGACKVCDDPHACPAAPALGVRLQNLVPRVGDFRRVR